MTGSQRTYITHSLAKKLGLKTEKEQEMKLSTFGSDKSQVIKTASTTISLHLNNGQYLNIAANIVPVISGCIVRRPVNVSSLGHLLKSIDLADSIPRDSEFSTVDLLLGNDYYLDVVLPQRMEVQPGLHLLGSKFGWILTGRTPQETKELNETNFLIVTYGTMETKTSVFQNIDTVIPRKPDLQDFWNVESIGIKEDYLKDDDVQALENFKDSVRFQNSRYQVTWPWKQEIPDLPSNRNLAFGRLKSCVKRLNRDPELMKRYNSIINEQLENEVIEKVSCSHTKGFLPYMPHHPVITPKKTTNKLRIVYDASARANEDTPSLNDCLF